MSLRDRLKKKVPAQPTTGANGRTAAGTASEPRATTPAVSLSDRRHGLKARVHRRMVERLNLASLDNVDSDALLKQIQLGIADLIHEEAIPLTEAQRAQLEQEVLNETFGLGPIEPLLHDPDVADILVNTHRRVYVERFGRLEATDVRFDDDAHLMKFIDRIVSRMGRRIDESSPMVDARLPDGSRVNAIIPPLALDGPILSIRLRRTLNLEDPLKTRRSAPAAELLKPRARPPNILISGGTGSR
jgi:pilus assembly protein CpaF